MSKKRFLLVLFFLGLLTASCSDATADDSTRDEDGAVIEGGDVGVLALVIGDCFDDPSDGFTGDEPTEIVSVAAIPCDEPHDNQAYATFDLPDGDWPGDDAVVDDALAGCLERFEVAVGEPYDTSPLDVFPLRPTETGWDAGDQEVLCAIYNVDLSKLSEDVLG